MSRRWKAAVKMLSLEQEGGDPMKGDLSEFYDKDQMSSIWPEAYKDWVQDWDDTVNKEGGLSTACCGGEPLEKRILWPIERP
jgi:hypothetical protein